MAGSVPAAMKLAAQRLLSRFPRFQRPKNTKGYYHLRRYTWRSLLTVLGPLAIVAFYAYICFAILLQPPQNGIVPTVRVSGRAIFYIWFALSVFALDWARTGLANIEAAALIHPRLAPSTAGQLMWHTDNKWANPLWWLRALRYAIAQAFRKFKSANKDSQSGPAYLWVFLAGTHFLLFVSLPLSGLTMEINTVSTYSDRQVLILGPNATTFNKRAVIDFSPEIRALWQSGRPTIPRDGSVIYAPFGTKNVSSTFFDDRASTYADSIEFFVAPAVQESVYGKTWGVQNNISCLPVSKDQLHTFRIHGIGSQNYSVKACVDSYSPGCKLQWYDYNNTSQIDSRNPKRPITIPTWLNETGASGANTIFDIFIAADGYYAGDANNANPYIRDSNHDPSTFDHIEGGRPVEQVTTGMFEMFLWQMHLYNDTIQDELARGYSADPVEVAYYLGQPYVGIAVHCDVTSSVGYAELDPTSLTYKSFIKSKAEHEAQAVYGGPRSGVLPGQGDVCPPQILAIRALAKERGLTTPVGPLIPLNLDTGGSFSSQTWVALHDAINSLPIPRTGRDVTLRRSYHSLTPKDLQFALYKLLGQATIAMMDGGGVNSSYGDLYGLDQVTYLVPGLVPWKYIFVLLCLWASIMCIGALWMLLFAGRRWAPTLDGIEMFKFGAELTDEVHRFEKIGLRGCNNALNSVPGMVGILPGHQTGTRILGFVGLSENVVSQDIQYTLDRDQASRTRLT